MAGNTFGILFRLTTFGESHGMAVGGVIDGCPAGLPVDETFIQSELEKRRPGNSASGTTRAESDHVEFLSGIFEGKSTGAPIAFLVRNTDQRSADYEHLKNTYRPSHADFTWEQKYGFRDWRGGGRASARETLARVVAGAVAKLILKATDIHIHAYVSRVGDVPLELPYQRLNLADTWANPVRCPHAPVAARMQEAITVAAGDGDTLGGIVSCVITGVPAGIGEPVFDKLHADLGKAMLSINAAKGFEYGSGFTSARMHGSQHNDTFFTGSNGHVATRTNHSGGIQGGISNGMDITFNVAFKPVATLMSNQESVTTAGEKITLQGKGRHDVCVVPRAVPVVEAMAALVVADHLLRNRTSRL